MPDLPNIAEHAKDYQPNAYHRYSMAELGQWVHLLSTRATHRANAEKRQKDLNDAQNYLDMMQEKLDALYAEYEEKI